MPSARAKGLGLGVLIVKRTAALRGHPLGLQASPGQGGGFYFDPPRREGLADDALPALPDTPAVAPLALIVIDDDALAVWRAGSADHRRQTGHGTSSEVSMQAAASNLNIDLPCVVLDGVHRHTDVDLVFVETSAPGDEPLRPRCCTRKPSAWRDGTGTSRYRRWSLCGYLPR